MDFVENVIFQQKSNDGKGQIDKSFTILVPPNRNNINLSSWSTDHKQWKVIKYSDSIGSEFDYVVVFIENDRVNLEVFSRAKCGLVIVTR